MKAAQINSYGEPEVIEINNDAPKPSLKPGQILIENHAVSINPFDGKFRSGILQKMVSPPMPITLGGDFAGKVIQVGEGVTDFKLGDEVYGQAIILNGGSGSMAEYVAANAANSSFKPKTANFETAAALPLAGVSALQALEENIKLQSGQKILVHGGAGGIGHIAIQLAKSTGAYVATTSKAEDFEFVKRLGADATIDYQTQKFEEIIKEYDAVFDTVGGEVTDKSFRVLKKGGIIVSMAGQPNPESANKHEITAIGQNSKTDTARLSRLAELFDSNKFKVHIDKVFPLNKIKEAFTFQEKTHPRGKVVISIR